MARGPAQAPGIAGRWPPSALIRPSGPPKRRYGDRRQPQLAARPMGGTSADQPDCLGRGVLFRAPGVGRAFIEADRSPGTDGCPAGLDRSRRLFDAPRGRDRDFAGPPDLRRLRVARGGRQGWRRGGLQGQAAESESPGRTQDDSAGSVRPPVGQGAVPRRGGDGREPVTPEHHPHPRGGRASGPALFQHGLSGGGQPGRADREVQPHRTRGGVAGRCGRPRGPRRAPVWRPPPRLEAVEHPARRRGAAPCRRLRAGQADRRRRRDYPDGGDPRHTLLYGPGAGRGGSPVGHDRDRRSRYRRDPL